MAGSLPVSPVLQGGEASLDTLFFYRKASTESNIGLTHPLPQKIHLLTCLAFFSCLPVELGLSSVEQLFYGLS